jgi:excisionase family DNA binding protein
MGDPKTNTDHKAAAVGGRKAFSPDEAAKAYGVGRSLIYEHLAAGLLTAKKAGARTLIATSVLDAWFENLPASSKAKRRAA